MQGKRVFTFPTAGRFMAQFGVVPVTVPWEDVEIALQTGELDGLAWCGITEAYEVGWADIANYFLTNNISGAWIGHFFANMDRWNEVPAHLQEMMRLAFDSSHYYRQHWYWGGEAELRTRGGKLELTSIPDAEWAHGGGRGAGILGRDRRRGRRAGPGGRDLPQLQRHHARGRPALSLYLIKTPARRGPPRRVTAAGARRIAATTC
jgi:hypothetical protein